MGDGYGSNGNLPPGFRFYPTDEELVVHFLHRKASLLPCHPDVIPDLDLYPYDPWDLPGKAMGEGRQWYYYSRKTQNRETRNGYWRSMEMDEPIFTSSGNRKVGVKKYLTFYLGDSPTSWLMQEYSLPDSSSGRSSSKRGIRSSGSSHRTDYGKWVLCRVYEQNSNEEDDDGTELSCLDEVFLSLDDLDEVSLP
ncbi:PREDICTED: NAC domain-containing protein 104 [Tarenaya hassleriana]|uniref:NAC domain-containing protein 104 n=1 Tax=Tarenaya hassleriana TaxID=28532 RepID=UPI00053C123D|nr:PREDICTED: NAC domain-containing protein 104 [Tarenaya hassleriana]